LTIKVDIYDASSSQSKLNIPLGDRTVQHTLGR